jgi:hypothetical protein
MASMASHRGVWSQIGIARHFGGQKEEISAFA